MPANWNGTFSGGAAMWNTALDSEFAFKTLLAPGSGLQLVNVSNPTANLDLAEVALAEAQATPQGQARIALVAALADVEFEASPYLRPFDQLTADCQFGFLCGNPFLRFNQR